MMNTTGIIFLILTFVFANILGIWGSKKWFGVALITGFLAGIFLGFSTSVFNLPPGLLGSILLGIAINLVFVVGGWITRFHRERGLEELRRKRKK